MAQDETFTRGVERANELAAAADPIKPDLVAEVRSFLVTTIKAEEAMTCSERVSGGEGEHNTPESS